MFNALLRPLVSRVSGPLGAALVRAGLSPDVVTVAGTLGVLLVAIFVVAPGHPLAGLIGITAFCLTDMIDGAMARAANRASRWGAFLDSTCDRIADGAIFGAAAYWQFADGHTSAGIASLCALVTGVVVSYAKARAEGLGMTANVGIAERGARLVLVGVGGLLEIFGVPHGLEVVLWLIAALGAVTVFQRMYTVWQQTRADVPGVFGPPPAAPQPSVPQPPDAGSAGGSAPVADANAQAGGEQG
jgi:CDP-diacylglycerol--glycerol-3-phosphate 3-phosphatidyltransferase